jgi:hypothetical protein
MKTLSRLLMLAALATAFALPAFAQDPAASPAASPVALCDEAAKNDLYTQYYNLKKTNKPDDQAKAYEITKQYIAKYDSCTDQYTTALKTWAGKYAAAVGSINKRSDFFSAYNAKDIAKTNSAARQLLASDPNDAAAAMLAAWGTYLVIGKNPAATEADAVNFANQALTLIQSGQEPKDLGGKVSWAPFATKEDATSYMNLIVAGAEIKTNTDDSVKRLVEIAQGTSKAKEEPKVYSFLAFAYEKEAAPMYDKYKSITKNLTVETDESKLLLLNINQVVDRQIDAYARAVAYETDPTKKAQLMSILSELYKSRHNNTVTGLDSYVAGIKAQPLLLTQPITSLPAAAPATTPGTGDGTTSTTSPAAPPTAPAAAPVGTTKPATTTTAKPATTTTSSTPVKKKP